MTDPDRMPQRTPDEPSRNDVSLWILVGLMVLLAVGGLVYGLSYPSLNASNSPQTVGSAPSHDRSGHRL
jgi:hypothetical protein